MMFNYLQLWIIFDHITSLPVQTSMACQCATTAILITLLSDYHTILYQSKTSRNVTLTVTAPVSGALGRAPGGRCSPSGRQTRRFRGSVTRDSATYRDPCAKTGSGMYTATRPLQVCCPCDFAMVFANATHTGNCVRRHR